MTDRILMCAPHHYDVDYVINPWMEGNIHRSSRDRAEAQWNQLYEVLKTHAEVVLVEPQKGWPDMVFAANAGLVLGDQCVLSRFFHPERQGEEPHFQKWFEDNGFTVHTLPESLPFEGAGDALIDRAGHWVWAGYGFRSELDSHAYLAKWLDVEVVSLRLVDNRFYHLDTCFCPLKDGYLMYYPPAFDDYSNRLIEMRVPEDKRIVIEEVDAINFACNTVNVDRVVVMNKASEALTKALGDRGFKVVETPLTEFLKAGGAAKCLTLKVNEARQATPQSSTIESRTILMEGHLLDSGLVNRALDTIVAGGGSFQVLSFDLGKQRQDSSRAEVKVSAPDDSVMGDIMGQLVDLGAVTMPDEEAAISAALEGVVQDGVAPDDFYVTTIYPTEVCVDRQWLRVEGQRMDGAIAITQDKGQSVAKCKLLRDLLEGEEVVVGSKGIHTIRTAPSLKKKMDDFSFMGAGVSSERRVELVVDQIAWDLRQIRDRGGKVVVTAGPVVIHTGGSEHLKNLIRGGYVHALLGGNAIAVHDIEQSMKGTSLGMDMKRGVSVHGGHRHHLQAINTVRRHGSIAKTVEAGVLKSGVMYECVKNNIPFSLAGSIRDDGPLPDTKMDLLEAQADYARLIEGADLILMLSTMLHSIGVGNMTPAGVKMVCVDINPAVVTKLSDRGSVESTGVVTDVGLFLSLLVQKLGKLTGQYAQV
ncbi:MAG: TIGR00300 family protein [Leptolyngbya foveolarum]|uniref:ornithine cyclodeaminase n=1 Tax=Leptolyngbya foveolarum TaxID=47253 RepID=A0A2W4WLI8_9CYAN|nr:MAG: TIGR00300 family protein [Leptolyngbya foveolarum]